MLKSFRKQLPVYILFALMSSLFFAACGKKDIARAKEIPESVKNYVYAYTTGVISKNDPVRIRFAGAAVSEDKIGQQAGDVLDFSPSTNGTAIWEDDHTVRFEPKNGWESGASYIATVSLDEVFDNLPKEAKSFEFDFLVREQSLSAQVYGIEAEDPNDLTKQQLKGAVATNDAAQAEDLEKTLTVTQNGKELPLTWDHDATGLNHYFTATGIVRGEKATSVEVNWNGKPVGVKVKDSKKVEIPSLGDFTVMSARVVSEENQYVVLHFSDPLLPSQDINGLIGLRGGGKAAQDDEYYYDPQPINLNFTVDGNKVFVYPSRRLAGEQTLEVRPGIRNIADRSMENPCV